MRLERVIIALVTIAVCSVLTTGCGVSKRIAAEKCAKIATSWGIQEDRRNDLLQSLGVAAGKEAITLFKMKQHSLINKEQYGEACVHVIKEHEHGSA